MMAETDQVAVAITELAQAWNGGQLDITSPVLDEEILAAEQ